MISGVRSRSRDLVDDHGLDLAGRDPLHRAGLRSDRVDAGGDVVAVELVAFFRVCIGVIARPFWPRRSGPSAAPVSARVPLAARFRGLSA